MLHCELGAHPHTVRVNQSAMEKAVRPRKVDVLEDATRPLDTLARMLHRPDTVAIDQNSLARLDLPDVVRADVVESAGLGCYHPSVAESAEAQRPHPQRVSDPQKLVLREHGERVCTLQLPHHVRNTSLPVHGGGVREEVGDDLGVAGAVESETRLLHLPAQLDRVDHISVMCHRQLYVGASRHDRLSVNDAIGAGGGVTSVGDRDVAREVLEVVFSERLIDQSHSRAASELGSVSGGDAGALLSPMLERVDSKVSDAGRILSAQVNSDHTASFAGNVGEIVRPVQVIAVRTDGTPLPRPRYLVALRITSRGSKGHHAREGKRPHPDYMHLTDRRSNENTHQGLHRPTDISLDSQGGSHLGSLRHALTGTDSYARNELAL